jgi:hypothetical protein
MPDDLEVLEILSIPDPAPYDYVEAVNTDFLLTALLRKQRGMLHAELDVARQGVRDEVVRWLFRGTEQGEESITQCPAIFFRPTLACFGYRYMDGQVYGGHIRRVLTQTGRTFVREIFMSNQNWSGFWIRVYVTPYVT